MQTFPNAKPFNAIPVFAALLLALVTGIGGGEIKSPIRSVVVFGDSTTASRVVDGKTIPVYADVLAAEGKPWGVQFFNAGVPGNTTADARARFERDVLSRKPDLVIVQFAINDAAVDVWRSPAASEPRVALKAYAENLRHFVAESRRDGANVILMTPNPIRWTPKLRELYGKPPYQADDADGFNVVLKDYAQAVRDVAKETGVGLVDVFAAFQKFGAETNHSTDELLLDGMHPNAQGHRLVAELLREKIAAMTLASGNASQVFKPAGGGVEIDSRATELAEQVQGPFVRLGDGRLLTVNESNCLTSSDEGATWQAKAIFPDAAKFKISQERVILRTREGVVIVAFMNYAEKHWTWDDKIGDAPGAVLPNYVMRSPDDGATWEPPQKLHDDWTGAVRTILQTRSGRVVFTSMQMRHNPGRHTVLTYGSDDQGKSWRASNVLDMGGAGHHDGLTEATIVELKNGKLLKLIRTNWGRFWRAESDDEGRTWKLLGPSDISASASPGQLLRLASGRIVLVWNREFPEGANSFPRSGGDRLWSAVPTSVFRAELSMAFSDDECKTWSQPVVIARKTQQPKPGERAWLSYAYLFERTPGELWVTTMQGGVRLSLPLADFGPAR